MLWQMYYTRIFWSVRNYFKAVLCLPCLQIDILSLDFLLIPGSFFYHLWINHVLLCKYNVLFSDFFCFKILIIFKFKLKSQREFHINSNFIILIIMFIIFFKVCNNIKNVFYTSSYSILKLLIIARKWVVVNLF